MYPIGSLGYEAQGRHLRTLDAYIEARAGVRARLANQSMLNVEQRELLAQEAMSVSDFPTYIGSFQRRSFLGRYTEVSGAWAQYTHTMSVEDFETYTTSRFGRFPDIPQKPLNGPYEHMAIQELPGPSIKLIEWGAAWSLTRQLVLSDRLGKIRDLPTLAADAMARTVSKRAVSVLLSNPLTYDGIALIHASHNNIGSTALTADIAGVTALIAAFDAIDTQTDAEGYKIVGPGSNYTLIIPRQLRWIAEQLRDQPTLPLDVTSGTSLQRSNQVQGRFTIVEEPYLTDANNWYVTVDPQGDNGFIAAITLNGNTTPFIGLKDPGVRGILGGDDPYSFDFDEIDYKVRHDFDFVPLEWRNVYGSIVA